MAILFCLPLVSRETNLKQQNEGVRTNIGQRRTRWEQRKFEILLLFTNCNFYLYHHERRHPQ